MNIWVLAFIILVIAILMVMTGHGGGNFFIIALVLAGIDMHIAATSVQFILFTAAFFAMLVFGTKKFVEWKLAIFMGVLIGISAFSGGYFSDYVPDKTLKLILSVLLVILALFMLKPVRGNATRGVKTDWHYWPVSSFDHSVIYYINLAIVVPTVLAFGFIAGMVGISGGSFMVPLLVLACGVPMKNAVGTASSLVAASALSGLIGHAVSGHFDYRIAVPLAIGGTVGGLIGGSIAIKSRPTLRRVLFVVTTLLAALILAYKAFT